MFFHPNMAQVRMKRLRCGDIDNMLEAMGGREFLQNKTVLDCTLGFASDAIISSYGVGPNVRLRRGMAGYQVEIAGTTGCGEGRGGTGSGKSAPGIKNRLPKILNY